jgi:hypothetical protein
MKRTEYFEPLQCGLLRAEIDFEGRVVTLYLPELECTDMKGAIAYAKGLDPDVAGERADTCYVRSSGEHWSAFIPHD